MAATASMETIGLRPCSEFTQAQATWPRGDRPAALTAAAEEFRARFKPAGEVRAIRTIPLATAAYPASFAFQGAARAANPYITIVNRLVVVQYDDFEGRLRTLAWEPTVADGSAEAPFFAQMIERYGEFVSRRVLSKEFHSVQSALAGVGLRPADVDYVSFDHLHVQDVRMIMGSEGGARSFPALFPDALLIAQRKEIDTFRSPHPTQWAWYVDGGMEGVDHDRVIEVDGDVELGVGVALLATPGHTDGNHSLCVNTPEGIWVSSENGVSADNWHPHASRIPGVRKWAEFYRREVVMNANTLEDSVDQYDSMLKERAVADPNPRDPRWRNVMPSSELTDHMRHWPVRPTFTYGGMAYGAIVTPGRGR